MKKKTKAVLKEAARLNKQNKINAVPKISRKLYTDKEKDQLKSLRNERNKYQRQLDRIEKSSMLTMKSIRSFLNKEDGSPLAQAGAFSDENYDTRDFRDVLKDNPELIDKIQDNIKNLSPELLTEQNPEAEEFRKKVAELNAKIDSIKDKALDRKEKEKLKNKVDKIQAKQDYKNAEALIDRIDKGSGVIHGLSEGEKATIDFVKRQAAGIIVNKLDLNPDGTLSPEEVNTLKRTLYSTIAFNPKEGVRTFIKSQVANEVIPKYGQDAANLSDALIDVATGKGSGRFVGLAIFQGVVNRSSLNSSVMNERAAELIDAGESTKEQENMKKLGRDVVVDIAKDIIKAGGNLYAAIPLAMKDILLDTGRAYIRSQKK